MARDLAVITIDCWRQDAFKLDTMPDLASITEDWEQGIELVAGGSTPNAFPSLLASNLPHRVIGPGGEVRDDVQSLPEYLSDAGYTTAFAAASNPFLGVWPDRFDMFWNDGMIKKEADINRSDRRLDMAKRFLSFRSRVEDREVLDRARTYWQEMSSPRFLWCHLMGPHSPYYPGLTRARKSGLLRSYLSILGFAWSREDVPRWMQAHLRELYDQCVRQLDAVLTPFVREISKDASVIITADHGEEFNHGAFGHARLYNEVVRCPYLANDPQLMPASGGIRQFDIAPTICDVADLKSPNDWQGMVADYRTTPVQPVVNHAPQRERIYIAAHDQSRKLIHVMDTEGELLRTERYDLRTDPTEQSPVEKLPEDEELVSVVDSVRKSGYPEWVVSDSKATIAPETEDRLSELGYVS